MMPDIGLVIVLICVIVIAQWRIRAADKKFAKLQKKSEGLIREVEERIEKEILEKIDELNKTARWLEDQIAIVSMEKKMAAKAKEEGIELAQWAHNENVKVLLFKDSAEHLQEQAKKALKENKVEEFYVKENTIWLYDHYKKVVDVLAEMTKEDIKYDQIYELLHTANMSLGNVRNYFVKNFRQTPEQYRSQRVNLIEGRPFSKN